MSEAGPSTFSAAFTGRCPRCGKGALFAGYLTLAPSCSACRLDYSGFDPGDGPAVFVVLIVGAIVAGGALYVEFTYQPPYWVHAVIWIPAILILSFSFLRLAKSLLVVLQYKHQAREGRLVK
ncbi:MAG: DUF983 domain-containing protein [Alphaproteobacteria bacterium]|nr:DUF983 domain-containing protein [Alphaproteobacteria bacterium]MBU6471429.1 DUF983 domain-containing protein [Alphaproteobacteria bacterium]MDE2011299.1 DUF983 domain-containing protein [Alphaproteobacteria bacterium]MDE2073207.1 DUF983 domain-containing protein [Alphaproteobacteria bacterium]MDE2352610.1 DUF983 domain-containing protein [Alphaproteobacteria bacterium]